MQDQRCGEPGLHRSAIVLLECHEADIGKSAGLDTRHHAHHGPVVDGPVAAHEDARIRPGGADRLQLGDQVLKADFLFLDEDAALAVDGNDKTQRAKAVMFRSNGIIIIYDYLYVAM